MLFRCSFHRHRRCERDAILIILYYNYHYCCNTDTLFDSKGNRFNAIRTCIMRTHFSFFLSFAITFVWSIFRSQAFGRFATFSTRPGRGSGCREKKSTKVHTVRGTKFDIESLIIIRTYIVVCFKNALIELSSLRPRTRRNPARLRRIPRPARNVFTEFRSFRCRSCAPFHRAGIARNTSLTRILTGKKKKN